MKYSNTTAFKKIAAMEKRLRIIQGGTSAGKTIAILLALIDIAQYQENKTISIVSETIPHLKRGAIRDFLNIMEGHGYFREANWNRTDFIYKFETGTKIEFFSADSSDKVRGPRRDILFMNECNNMSYETYTQLAIRTNEIIYLDYNPVTEFWVHTDIIPKLDHDFLIITYKDNEQLPPAIVKEIESRKNNRYFWQVYGLGQLGEIEGKIYKDWQIIDEIPHEARLVGTGLDFGYTNDPSAGVDLYEYNGGFIWDERFYKRGLLNKPIADILLNDPVAPFTVADSAEPKSIAEIESYGVTIIGAEKGKDSVVNGISVVQSQRISVTKRSLNIIREYRNYQWVVDKDGKVINVPEQGFGHSMDAGRYIMVAVLRTGKGQISSFIPDW